MRGGGFGKARRGLPSGAQNRNGPGAFPQQERSSVQQQFAPAPRCQRKGGQQQQLEVVREHAHCACTRLGHGNLHRRGWPKRQRGRRESSVQNRLVRLALPLGVQHVDVVAHRHFIKRTLHAQPFYGLPELVVGGADIVAAGGVSVALLPGDAPGLKATGEPDMAEQRPRRIFALRHLIHRHTQQVFHVVPDDRGITGRHADGMSRSWVAAYQQQNRRAEPAPQLRDTLEGGTMRLLRSL